MSIAHCLHATHGAANRCERAYGVPHSGNMPFWLAIFCKCEGAVPFSAFAPRKLPLAYRVA
ncbi:hypothetical protein ERY430_41259 [Erythrobacter sp. EC-HK427]|nr:hypothetical protein ERY430_41259 [Erythrobacter sp. EC-HK427]